MRHVHAQHGRAAREQTVAHHERVCGLGPHTPESREAAVPQSREKRSFSRERELAPRALGAHVD
jgi:hypothetical protein